MHEIVKYIFFFLISTTVLNLIIALAARFKTRAPQFNSLVVYWLSLFLTYFAAAILGQNTKQIAFAYFFQAIPAYLMVKMLKDSRGENFNKKLYGSIWGAGALLSSYLILFTDANFTLSLVPVTFGTTIMYVGVTWNTLVKDRREANWIEKGLAWMFVSGVINHWNYAIFRLDETTAWWGWSVSIAQYQCLSIFLPLLINHHRSEIERSNIQQALDKLTGKNTIFHKQNIDDLYLTLEDQIHQKEELTKQLRKTNESLREEQETNEILIKTISHDLANPLTVVNAYIDMMLNDRIAVEEYKTTVGKIKNSTNSALDMITRIRNAVVTKNQSNIIRVSDVSVDDAITKLIEEFETRLQAKNIAIIYENTLSPGTNVIAEESSLIHNVFANVLSNAIKFSHNGSEIRITVIEDGDRVKFVFTDRGVGIEDHRLKERKLLLSTEGTNGETGTGFGFMIMSYFLRKFGGSYHLQSQGKDMGTVATVTLKKSLEVRPNLVLQQSDANYLS